MPKFSCVWQHPRGGFKTGTVILSNPYFSTQELEYFQSLNRKFILVDSPDRSDNVQLQTYWGDECAKDDLIWRNMIMEHIKHIVTIFVSMFLK